MQVQLQSKYNGYYYVVDIENDKNIGRCQVCERQHRLELWSVRIYTEFQRQGYGTFMLKEIIAKYGYNDKPLVLYVYKDNEIAIRLYEKLGFKIVGEYGSDAWTMQYIKENS